MIEDRRLIHSTNIAGSPHLTDFESAFQSAKERLSLVSDGEFLDLPIQYREELDFRYGYDVFPLRVKHEPVRPVEEYLTRYKERYNGATGVFMGSQDVALLLPHHKLALQTAKYWIEKLPHLRERIESLGYTLVDKKDGSNEKTYSDEWGYENTVNALRILRMSEFPQLHAADARAYEIIDTLAERTGIKEFQLAEFVPKHFHTARSPTLSHTYDDESLVVKPIKKLVDLPVLWISKLEEMCKGLALSRAIGITSRVKTRNGEKYIPMIDFSARVDWEGDRKIQDTLKKLNIPGMLVLSGASYHFYGFNLLDNSEWKSYMESLKGMWGVDCDWPDLQLQQGYSMLRLTPARGKLSQPCFLEYFEPKKTGTDAGSATRAEKIREKVAVAA